MAPVISAGMITNGYIALEVGTYGSGLTMIFDRDNIAFRAIDPTDTNAANWQDGPNAISNGHATMNTTAGLAGDRALNIVMTKAYGALSVGTPWTTFLAGGVPADIGASVNGNPAVFHQALTADGQATGAAAYTTNGPNNSYVNLPIFARAT